MTLKLPKKMQSATTLSAATCSSPIKALGTSARTFRYFFSVAISCYCTCILNISMHCLHLAIPMTLDPAGVVLLTVCHHPRSSSERPSGATYALADLAFTANLARLNFRTTCTHFSSCLSYQPSFLVVSLLLLYQPHCFA